MGLFDNFLKDIMELELWSLWFLFNLGAIDFYHLLEKAYYKWYNER